MNTDEHILRSKEQKDSREKNYAPIPTWIKNLEKSIDTKKYQERQIRRQQIAQHITPCANFHTTNKHQTMTRKRHNKINALRRLNLKCNISPYLNFKFNESLSVEQRLRCYNSKHKCSHKRHFNQFETYQCETCREPHLKFTCDHERETTTLRPAKTCPSCNHMMNVIIRDCACIVVSCTFCKLTQYTHQEDTKPWCVCFLPPIVNNADVFKEFLEKHVKIKSTAPKPTWKKIPQPPIEDLASLSINAQTTPPSQPKRMSRFKKPLKVKPHKRSFETGTPEELQLEDSDDENYHQQRDSSPEDIREDDRIDDDCGHPIYEHMGLLSNYSFVQRVSLAYYFTVREQFNIFLQSASFADAITFYSAISDELDPYYTLKLATEMDGFSNDRISFLMRGTVRRCFRLLNDEDKKLKNGVGTTSFTTRKCRGQDVIFHWQYETGKLNVTFLEEAFAEFEDAIEVEPHGAAASGFKTVKDIGTTAAKSVIDAICKLGKKIGNFFNDMALGIGNLLDRMRNKIRYYFVEDIIKKIEDFVKSRPGTLIAMMSNAIGIFAADGLKDVTLSLISLLGIVFDMVSAAPSPVDAPIVVKLKKDFPSEDPEQVEILYESMSDSSKNITPSEVLTKIVDIIAEPEEEVEEPVGEPLKVEKHRQNSIITSSSILKVIGYIFGFSKNVVNSAMRIGFNGLKNFNTLCTTRKHLSEILSGIGSILPDWIQTLITVGNTKAYVATHVTDEGHPLGSAFHHAFTYWKMARLGADVLHTNTQLHIAQKAYTDWVTYAVEKKIPQDIEIKKINKSIEDFLSMTTKPMARDKEPFMIRLSGDSGVCKSTIWPVLISATPDFCKAQSVKEILDVTYTRQVMSEYWDGYNNDKLIVLYDDFNHHREEIDLAEMINIGSTAAYMPAMASVDSANTNVGVKGTQFTSPYIVMLTNNRQIVPNTLFSAEAINRRRHIHLHMTFRKNTNGKRMQRAPDFSHIKFELEYSASGQRVTDDKSLTVAEVRDLVAEEYRAYEKKQESIRFNVDALLTGNSKIMGKSNIRARKDDEIEDHTQELPTTENVDDFLMSVHNTLALSKIPSMFSDVPESRLKLKAEKHGTPQMLGYFYEAARRDVARICNYFKQTKTRLSYHLNSAVDAVLWEVAQTAWFVKENLTRIAVTVGAIVAGFIVVQTCIHLYRNMTAQTVTPHSGTNMTPKYRDHVKITTKHGNTDDLVTIIDQNIVKITQLTEEGEHTLNHQNALFVHGTVLLTTEHFFMDESASATTKYVKEGTKFSIYSPQTKGMEETFTFDSSRVHPVKGADGKYADCVLYELPETFRARRSILKHFWNGASNLTNRQYVNSHINRVNHLTSFRGKITRDNVVVTYDIGPKGREVATVMHKTFTYDFRSLPGDCGTPIMCDDDSFQQKIIGIHVAGYTTNQMATSIGLIITQDALHAAMKDINTITREEYINCEKHGYRLPTEEDVDKAALPGKLTVYGVSKFSYMPPMETDIVPSPLHNLITTATTKPAHLNQYIALKNGVNILKKGISKYSHYNPPMDEDIMRDVTDSMAQQINHIPTINPRRILTMEEAINGLEGYQNIGRMTMTTSSGYPFIVDPKLTQYKGEKRKLFDYDEETEKFTPKPVLREMVEEALVKLKKGIIPDLPFVDCTKDERRPIEKVDAYKTRIFSICPVAMTIISRMYMLAFTSHLIDIRLKTHMAMGMNKNSREWNTFYNYLREYDDEGCDADYEEYDGRSHKRLMKVHFDLANNFYQDGKEAELVRLTLWKYVSESTHIYYDVETRTCFLYCCDGGNPSGQGETTQVNSNGNQAGLMYTWVKLVPDKVKDPINYYQYVRAVVYGDDCIYTVKRELKDTFTPNNIQAEMLKIGMKFGPSDKLSSNFQSFKRLEDCTFLKNSTIDFHGWKVPRMEDRAQFETLNWIRQGKTAPPPEVCCEDNCNDVLRNIFFRGPQEFNGLRNKILELRPNYRLLHYKYLESEFLNCGAVMDPFTNNGYKKLPHF